MYEDIRKPRLLQHIPLLLIRPLPIIYYYCRHAQKNEPTPLREIYRSHVHYLSEALDRFAQQAQIGELKEVARSVAALIRVAEQKRLEEITVALSRICNRHQSEIRQALQALRPALVTLYRERTRKIRVLAVDVNNEPERIEKLLNTLTRYCYYPCDRCGPSGKEFPLRMVETDFVLFTSTFPPQIHSLVESLKTYRKPGLALATIDLEMQAEKQSLRHGAQLQRIGFPVIYKTFTPIRLFTSIDKAYVQYHLLRGSEARQSPPPGREIPFAVSR